jgi:hypothetical protein
MRIYQISAGKPGRGNACRLLEIAKRNLLRREAGLPLISIPKELRLGKG